MFIIIGLVIVIGSVLFGYTMHHGKIMVLMQTSEFIIIGGAGLGALIVSNPPNTLGRMVKSLLALLKPSPFGHKANAELLQVLYEVFQTARKDGLIALESHIEEPSKSTLFSKHHGFLHHKNVVAFLCDTLKVLLTGAVEDHHLSEILDMDLERQHDEEMEIPNAIAKVADAMPGFGIVAAVLGVVITMGSIGGEASAVGEKVAAALVGTFLGILLSYGVLGPLATAAEGRVRSEGSYMSCIRTALLGFARGDSPMTCVEFARRNIEPNVRPSFAELEALTRRKAA